MIVWSMKAKFHHAHVPPPNRVPSGRPLNLIDFDALAAMLLAVVVSWWCAESKWKDSGWSVRGRMVGGVSVGG
jgi:hypothetical protein